MFTGISSEESKKTDVPDPKQTQELETKRAAESAEAPPVPMSEVAPVVPEQGLGPQIVALAKYMMRTEVHTYAFSVAANVILSLFPFIVMLLTISRLIVHSNAMNPVITDIVSNFLPAHQEFIMGWMVRLANPRKGMQIYSVVMLLISSTGVFLPLEVALNGVWGVRQNRSYLRNQAVSLSLALLIGLLAMASVGFTAGQRSLLTLLLFGHIHNVFYTFLDGSMLKIIGMVVSVLIFFLIYWILPNRKVPARAVLPTAIVIGLLWDLAKYLYVLALPKLDFRSVYGPFEVSVGLMIWAFLSGLLLLAGAHFSATRYALAVARQEERKQKEEREESTESGSNG
jgi:membrane protein